MTRSRSGDNSADPAVLDSLKARELGLRLAKVERVTVVKFRVNKRRLDLRHVVGAHMQWASGALLPSSYLIFYFILIIYLFYFIYLFSLSILYIL